MSGLCTLRIVAVRGSQQPSSGSGAAGPVHRLRGDADLDRGGMDLDPQLLDGGARSAVKLVGKPPAEPDLELLTPRHLHERRLPGLTQRDPPPGPGPLDRILGRDHTEIEEPVVRLRPAEGLDSTEAPSHVSHQDPRTYEGPR